MISPSIGMRKIAGSVLLWMTILLTGCLPQTPIAPTITPIPGVTVINPAKPVSDFTLTNQDGVATHLSDFKGKLVLITFGYTHCPDVCPITLAHFKQIKDELGQSADQLAFLFVSVDGARDTPTRLKEYLPVFDPQFVGLTSDEKTMRQVVKDYGVIFELKNAGGLKSDYVVEHTAGTYLVDKNGQWVRRYAYDADPIIVANNIQQVIAPVAKSS